MSRGQGVGGGRVQRSEGRLGSHVEFRGWAESHVQVRVLQGHMQRTDGRK